MLAANHKRILRNTGMLYMRMLLVMAVTLYTSRVVLAVLGVEDFGIYHVVAGFVALLGFMQGAMTTATQRYFAFDLGEACGKNLNRIFNTSLLIHTLLALLIALVAETAGYWFVTTQLTIPDERMAAALWAYHLAIASFAISVITVPFTAMLMAHERMGIFALIGMLDVLLKLAAVILLQHLQSDKLIAYAGLLLLVSLTTLSLYITANKLLFRQIKLRWQWHKHQFRSMLSYTAWNTWGNLAAALSGQGNNILLNIFFGPAVNAGKSISDQANAALYNFVVSVQAAINPQIIKLYASGETAAMHRLVLHASKYNFFILLMLALPVVLNTDAMLGLWLVQVPPYAAIFLQLTIVNSLIDAFAGPLMTTAQATGKIRAYQTIIGGILLLTIPLGYLALLRWEQPEVVFVASIGISFIAFAARLFILKRLTKLDIKTYTKSVLARSLITTALIVSVIMLLDPAQPENFLQLFTNVVIIMVLSGVVVVFVGLSRMERNKAYQAIISVKRKNSSKVALLVIWLARKLGRAVFFKTPFGETVSVLHSLYLHLRFSFSDRAPGKDRERLRYYLVKHCHVVEKGLALPEPRAGFGQPKITDLIRRAKIYEQLFGQDAVTQMIRDMLRAYLKFHQEIAYKLPAAFESSIKIFNAETETAQKGGLTIRRKETWAEYSIEDFHRFLACRHSVRNFGPTPVKDEKIKAAITASLNTPSVCNRQGWLVHYYNNKCDIESLLAYQNGNAGFTGCIDKLLIITGNTKAFTLYEHNQLFIDGGLLSMNIMLSLHAGGLGSCPLNTCMPFFKEEKLKERAGIPKHEKLIMMIAVGDLKDTFAVAQSEKYSVDDVFRSH